MADPCLICGHGEPVFACKAILYPGCEKEIVSCPDCGVAYYRPIPSEEEVARCYPPAYFRDFLKQYWRDYFKGRMLAEAASAWKRGGTLLDVGCALGTLLAGFRDHSSWKVLGLEYSAPAAALGRELNGVDIATGGLSRAPWPEGSVDYMHCNNVLEHETRPADALAAAARLLAPGGRLHLTLPNGPVDLRATRDLYGRWGRAVATRHGGHLFFFSRRSLALLLEKSGLRTVRVRNFHFKLGMKARGWTPRAYRQFRGSPQPSQRREETLSAEEARRLIGPKVSWPLYRLRARLRRLWRWPVVDWGYDYEVLAEKPGRGAV